MLEFTTKQRLKVKADHQFHPNRIGYFCCLGEESQVVVLSADDTELCAEFFAVKFSDLVETEKRR